jgi:hypothetical protein
VAAAERTREKRRTQRAQARRSTDVDSLAHDRNPNRTGGKRKG